MKFTRIPIDTFKKLAMNAGVMARSFNPETGEILEEDIVGATTGGTNFTATPTFKDNGDDIDNCPKNMKELKELESWEANMTGTYVTVDTAAAADLVAAADVSGNKVTPRNSLKNSDFKDLWLIADYSDENSGENAGFIAVHMMNALSTGGFQMKTADKAKGQFAFTYTAHYSMDKQDEVPFELYVQAGTAAAEASEEQETE